MPTVIIARVDSLIRVLHIAQGHLLVVVAVVGSDEDERSGQEAQKCGEKLHRVELFP